MKERHQNQNNTGSLLRNLDGHLQELPQQSLIGRIQCSYSTLFIEEISILTNLQQATGYLCAQNTASMKFLSTLVFLLFSFTGFAQIDSSDGKIKLQTSVYSITYPETWRLDTSKTRGADLFLFSPVEAVGDQFSENVNLIIQNLSGKNISLEKYKEVSDRQISNMSVVVEVTESAIIQNQQGSFYRMQYAMTNGKFKLKIVSICYIKAEKAYLLTFTAEADKFEQFKVVGESILYSFILNTKS